MRLETALQTSLLCLSLLVCRAETNAIRNGDFKMGSAGFGVWRLLNRTENPNLEYLPLRVENQKLILDNSRGEYFQIRSAEFSLPANRQIHFSTSFQAPKGILDFSILHITKQGKWVTNHRSVTTTGKPQNFEFSFPTKEYGGAYMLVVYSSAPETPKGIFQFDSFRISGTGISQEILADSSPEKTLYILEDEKIANLKITLSAVSPSVRSGEMELTVKNPQLGAVLFRKKEKVDLENGILVRKIALPLTRYGMFATSILWNGKEIPVFNGVFSVIGKYTGKAEIDPVHDFVVGVNGGLGFVEKRGNSRGGFEAHGISPLKKYELLQKMGCRLIRDWDCGIQATDWRNMEPENGKFDFSTFDFSVDTARRHGMQILPVFGRMYENWSPSQREFRPEWLRKQLIRIEKNPPGTNPKFVVRVPPMELWKRYVAAFATHAGKRVSIYEVMNEPDLNMSPELYMKYMVPASAVLKKYAPHAAVIGICATGDKGNQVLGYLQACIQLGAGKYLDGISFHPYNARTLNSRMPADRQIELIRKIVGSKPLYNTEQYYLYDWENPYDHAGQSLPQAHHAAWRFLTDLGEGLKQSCVIHMNSLWKQPLHPTYAGTYRTEAVPSGVFVVYNTLARLFEGSRPVRKIRLPMNVIAYVYRKEGRLIAAVWNYAGKKGVFANLAPFEVMDLFGNKVKAGETLLSVNPFYLRPGNLSESEFLKKVETLPLRLDQPVSSAPVGRRVGNRLFVMLHNESDLEQSGVLGLTGGGLTAVSPLRFRIPPRTAQSFELPIKEVRKKDSPTELMLFLNGTTFRTPIEVISNQQVGKEFKLKNARGKLEFGNGRILLEMDVKDSTDAGRTGSRPLWETDCVELFFDTDPLNLPLIHPDAYTRSTFRLFITPRDPVQLHTWGAIQASACDLQIRSNPSGYSFRLEIPAETDALLGFDVKIDDAAGNSLRETTLGSGKKLFRNRCQFSLAGERKNQ